MPLELAPLQTTNTLPRPFPPPWACAWGDDRYGLWADFEVGDGEPALVQRMRWVEPGQFMMGAKEGEADSQAHEHPQHPVTISSGFWLANTACTQGFWQAIMGKNPSHFNDNNHGGPNHPVEHVSWIDIQAFLRQLQAILPACHVGLPTEAEWEYACRAGTTTPFSFGEKISRALVNCREYSYGGGGDGDGGEWRGHTVAVKDLPANEWGLYQMHGNVWEWCSDQPRTYTADAVQDPGLAEALQPVANNETVRALRGGSWVSSARLLRSAFRFRSGPGGRNQVTGFRLALRPSGLASRF
jgi:formylglycine-generating enzyme required for sulfatase activity